MSMLSNLLLASLLISTTVAVKSECAATTRGSEECQVKLDIVEPSDAKDVVLLQVSQRAWQSLDAQAGAQDAPVVSNGGGVGKIQWVANDPYFDEDYTKDDQPGSADAEPAPNTTVGAVQLAKAARTDSAAAPATPVAPAGANTSAAPAGNGTSAPAANGTVTAAPPAENATAPNTTEAPANATGCATRKDPRATAWFAETSPEGTPCVFGVDARDEGKHCIHDAGQFGSNGWCFTAKDRSSWGSCNDKCPLYGAPAALGKKIDTVAKKLDQVADSLGGAPEGAPSSLAAQALPLPAAN